MRSLITAGMVLGLMAPSAIGGVDITLKARIGSTTYTNQVPASAFVPGEAVTLEIYAQNTTSGVLGVGGDVVASGASNLSTPPMGATWTVPSFPQPMYAADGMTQIGSVESYDSATSFAGCLPSGTIIRGNGVNVPDTFGGYTFPPTATVAARAATGVSCVNNAYSATGFNVGGIPTANGGMSRLGSGQVPSAFPNQGFGNASAALVCSYTFTWNSNNGGTKLTWVDAGKAGATAHGGWYTCGVALHDDGIGTAGSIVFAGTGPVAPSNPGPADGSADVPVNMILSWSADPGLTFDVYLDTVNPPATKVAGNVSTATFAPSLTPGTQYYWKVTAIDATDGRTDGVVWSFVTHLSADINGDKNVNLTDLTMLIAAWDSTPAATNWNAHADLDEDNWVNLPDLRILAVNFGRSIP